MTEEKYTKFRLICQFLVIIPPMRVLWRILATAFALCGAGNAVAQFTGDIAVDLTLDYDSQRVSVVFPSPEIDEGIVAGAGGEYYWRCQQTDIHTGEVIRENFAGIDVGHPNSRFLTFRQISTFIDISGCDHITADLRIYGSNTLTVSGVSVQIAGIRREGELPYVTVNIGHTGDGYDEGDVYSFTVIYTDILGVTQTVRSDEHARLARVFRSVLWRQVGVTRELEGTPHSFVETLIPQPPLSSFLDAPPLPINPVIGDRYLPPCVFESCEPDTSRFENESFDLTPFFFNLGFTVRLDNFTYTLSFKDVANSHTTNRDGYTVYMDHIAVELIERFSSFSNPNFFRAYHGYIHRNDMLQVVEPLEILRSHNPIRFAGTPVEEPVSFAEFANTADEELYISFDLAGDRNNGFQAGTRYIWQHRINGSAWQNTEDEFIRGVHFTSPDHFVGAEAGDEIQIRGILDIEDGWGFRNYLFSPTLSHTDRPPTGDMQFIETGLHAEATITTSLDEIEDPDGEIDVLSYRWQAGNGTVFTDVLFQEYDEATRRLFADNIKNVPYILQSSVFSQEGNSGMRVIAELTDSFFGRATITSGFFLVNPPTEGTVSINGNSLFSDGEIYTLNVDELTDGNEIGTFSYTWYVSIDGGNSYDRRGAFGTTFTLKASHIAEANADMPVLLRADVMHTDADGYTQPLVAFLEEDFPTQGEATINGNPLFAEGESYTVDISRLSDSNEIGDFTYEWHLFLDGVLLGVLPTDNEEFTIPANFFVDATPRMFSVNIVHTDLEGYKATLAATLKENLPTEGEITIDGNPSFADGEVYTAITAALSDENDIGGFTYQWLVSFDDGNNYNEIAGETGESYTLESGDLAGADENTPAWLQVSVVHTDADGYRFTLSASLKQDTPTQGEMTIDGNPLFAKDQTYDARTDALTDGNGIGLFTDFQWAISFDGGVNYEDVPTSEIPRLYRLGSRVLAGANPNTPARLRVSAVHTDADGYAQTVSGILIQNIPTQGEITIDGNPMFADGEIYTAITAELSDSNEIGGFTYQWLVSFDDGNNYNEIAGETGETYTADTADFAAANPNTPIFLGVSAVHTDADGYAQTITAFLEQDLPTQGDIVLNAIADPLGLGEVRFSVNVDALTDGNDIGDFAYQWFASIARDADYNPISAATDRSYILDRSDFAGAAANEPVRISVSVVHTDLAGYEQSFGDFFVQNPRTEGEITIDGNPMFADGEVYTAITAGLSDRNGIGDFTYQWVISFDGGNNYNTNGILGIDSTYTLRAEDIANADENIPALLGVAAVHTDLDGNTQTLTASFLQDIAGTGSVSISGTISFAAGEKYTAITNIADANGISVFVYSWHASTNGGNNYTQITGANSESYTLALSDFAGATSANPVHLLLSVVHTDMGGFSEFYLATLIHSDTAAGGSLGIEIQSGVIAEDAIVELDTAAISDINGGGIVSHSWHLDNGAAIAGATSATYILSSANLTLSEIRNGVLHSEVLYRDSFGYETRFSITLFGEGDDEEYDPDNPNELDSMGTGTVAISGTISFAANEKYTADISDIAPNDANGKGTFAYSWHTSTDGGTNYNLISGANSESYTLALSDFAGANANAEVHLRVSVVHTDFGGFDQSYLATLIYSDTAAGGSLGIEIQNGVIAEDAIVELDTAGVSDINGGGIVSHSWHLDNGAAIVGETSATYILSSANLTLSEIRNGVLHSEVLYRDSFGYETRFSITLFGEGDDEVANPDPNHPGTTTNPVDPGDNPGGEDPDNPGNIFGTGSVSISGANSFAAGEKYTAITNIADANMIGTVSYSWQASTDGGTNYTQITGANSESYTLALSDFSGATSANPVHLLLSVVHTDAAGFSEFYLATLIHSDTAAGGSLGIGIQSGVIAEDAIVELDTAAISDINGGGIVSHSWHLDNGAAIVGETSATYILSSANLTLSEIRNGVLHSEVLYRDNFGYETRFSITLFGEGDDEEYDPNNPNELDSIGTGTVAISGTISFAANERYTADISDIAPNDANGEGDFAYSWHTSTDGGNNYTQITGATLELYTLALSDFAGANANAEVHLRVSVVHTDFGGFDQSYLATLIHSDTAAGGSLGIEIQNGVIAEDAVVELDTAGISDINGGGIVSHSWHLDNGAAIVGETSATYTLQAANLTLSEIRNGVLHSEVLYRDDFGYETRFSITLFGEGDDEEYDPNNPNELDSLGTGTVAISGTISFAANEKYTADISDIAPNDANGEGDFAYSWHTSTDGGNNYTQITGATLELYTLALSDFAGANANAEVHLRVSVVHTDFGGFDQSYLATLIHSDTAAGGDLEIVAAGLMAGDLVTADAAGLADANGALTISYRWQTGERNTPESFADLVGETEAVYTIYADDYDSDSRDSLRLIARTADPFGGETEITSAILPINRETEGRISLELVGGEIVAGATIRLRTDAVSDENGGGFEKYYWFINDLLLMEENDDFLIVRSDDLRDIAAGGLRAEAKYVDGIGFTVRLSARLIAAGIVAPSPEEIANWSVVIETEGVAFGEDLARANLIGAEQSDYYEVFYRWRTGVGIAFADERNVGGVGNYHQLEAANFNPQDHLRAIAEVELLSGAFVTLTSAPVQIDYPSIGAVRIVAGELLAPGVVVSADISDVRDANGGVNVVSERWLYADTPVAMARSYTLTEEAVHAGKVFYEATFADAAGFRTSLRAEANVGGEVSSEKAEAIIGAVNAAAIDGLWNALEGHLDSEAGWRANGAPIEDPSQIAAALSRRDENSLHPDSPFALDSFALKESGGEAGEEWSWWAHGSRSRLKGKPIIGGEEVKYHGDYASFHAGMDRQISDTVRAGLAFGADDADLDVEWRKGVDGQLRQNIRSLIPYTEWRPDDLTNVRILAGYGEGDIYLAEHDNASRASARRTLFGIRAARRKDLADNFDITFSGGFDKTRLQTDAIDLPGLQDDLDARTKETHARVRGGHISLLPAKGSLHKEISLRWRSQSVAGDRDSVFDFGIGFNATLPEYFLSFGADGERQLTDSAHERNRFGVYIAYGAGRFAHILETRYDNEIALPQNRWQINTVSEWGISELLTGVYVEHNGNEDLRIGWESNLLF